MAIKGIEAIAEPPRLDTDYGIGLRIEGRAAAEGFDRDDGLLDFPGAPGKRAQDDEPQEAARTLRAGKGRTGQYSVKLCAYSVRIHERHYRRSSSFRDLSDGVARDSSVLGPSGLTPPRIWGSLSASGSNISSRLATEP